MVRSGSRVLLIRRGRRWEEHPGPNQARDLDGSGDSDESGDSDKSGDSD